MWNCSFLRINEIELNYHHQLSHLGLLLKNLTGTDQIEKLVHEVNCILFALKRLRKFLNLRNAKINPDLFMEHVQLLPIISLFCSMSWKRCSQNPVNHLKWSFSQKWLRDEAVTFFPKRRHLKCLTGFWIHLWLGLGVRLLVGSCLTLSWRRSLSYRKQSIDLQSKSMDWFRYDKDLCHERVHFLQSFISAEYFDHLLLTQLLDYSPAIFPFSYLVYDLT